MKDEQTLNADHKALNELVVDCPEFETLERLLGGFNLFQVLKFEYGELRHSNVLGWLMDPSESHGLDETFLKKWLMRAIYEAGPNHHQINAVDIDGWQLHEVEVRREWRNIDLLLILKFVDGSKWIVCIENKINSSQHSNQLEGYRRIVEHEFKDSKQKLYLFLTKNEEVAEDNHYIPTSYTQVHRALKECVAARTHLLGVEPKALLDSYLRLLEEKFMEQSEIAKIAQLIYKRHRRALDVIFEHRPNGVGAITAALYGLLQQKSGELEIELDNYDSGSIRFIPRTWNHPGNEHGTAWRDSKRTVVYQLRLDGKRPSLAIYAGKAPSEWLLPMWENSKKAPFVRKIKKSEPTPTWCKLHHAGEAPKGVEEEVEEPEVLAEELYKWLKLLYLSPDNQSVVRIIAESMASLEACFTSTNGVSPSE